MLKKKSIVAVFGNVLMIVFMGALFSHSANSGVLQQNEIDKKELPLCGGKTEKFLDPAIYKKEITEDNITEFSFSRQIPKSWDAESELDDVVVDFYELSAVLNNNEVVVSASGQNYRNNDDNSKFRLQYVTKDSNFLRRLNQFIKDNQLYKDNGHIKVVAGLQSGTGDMLTVKYENGDLIYVQNNQSGVMDKNTSNKLYSLFKDDAQLNGFDFTTQKSNVEIENNSK